MGQDEDDGGLASARTLEAASDLARFFRSRGHGPEAEDLVQDLFVLLLSKGDTVDARSAGRFRSFLFAVAYRIGANASRRRRSRREVPREGTGDPPAPAAGSPERIALSREGVRRAAAALETLPLEVRRTLLLVALDGRTTREAARELGVSEEVVRARLCRGRRRLASIMKESG